MFVLIDNGVKAECVVTKEADGIYELKNIAVMPDCQRKGYGKILIDFLLSYYTDCNAMLVGTGDVPSALSFYQMFLFTPYGVKFKELWKESNDMKNIKNVFIQIIEKPARKVIPFRLFNE